MHSTLLSIPGFALKWKRGRKPLGLQIHGSYAIYLKKHTYAMCELCGCAQSLRNQS